MLLKPKNSSFPSQVIAQVTLLLAIISQLVIPTAAKGENLQSSAYLRQNQVTSSFQAMLTDANAGSLNSAQGNPDQIVHAVITAYTSTPDQTDDSPFIAATGKRVYDGMIAANWLPFGTQIKIPSVYGDKIFTVDDRMNRRYGYGRLDVWLDATKTDARKFGVKRVDVEIFYVQKELARLDSGQAKR